MTKSHAHPFALRLIGYSVEDRTELSRHFAIHHKNGGFAYHALHEDNLLCPDLYLVNADSPDALVALDRLRPAPLRPALLVGSAPAALPYPFLLTPPDTETLLDGLDRLVEQRAEALSRLDASDKVTVPERRRRLPPDMQGAEYAALRRQAKEGGVLVVDKDAAFSETLARMLAPRRVRVDRANDFRTATILCKQFDTSLVFINTGTPAVDPYQLCEAIKTTGGHPITIIFVVGRYFSYHSAWAKAAGCEGFVTRPLTERQISSLLEKFLPRPSPQQEKAAG